MSWAMIVLITLTGFLILVPLLSYLASRRLIGKKIDLDNATTKSQLFYFHSPSCGPCRRMTPIIEQLAEERDDITKVDTSRDPATASKFGIRATPTTVLVENNTIIEVLLGAQSKKQLEQLLSKKV